MIESVLLVDDDNISNFLTERLIKSMLVAQEVRSCLNGTEALAFIDDLCSRTSKCPNLVILDINMPGMDGFEFLDKLEAKYPEKYLDVDVCILTTSAHQKDAEKAEEYGVRCFLQKPLTREKIQGVLDFFYNGLSAQVGNM